MWSALGARAHPTSTASSKNGQGFTPVAARAAQPS
jgi:hypothetical protein